MSCHWRALDGRLVATGVHIPAPVTQDPTQRSTWNVDPALTFPTVQYKVMSVGVTVVASPPGTSGPDPPLTVELRADVPAGFLAATL